MNACWFRVPGVAYCFGDQPADDGGVVGAGAGGWDGLAGAGFTFAERGCAPRGPARH